MVLGIIQMYKLSRIKDGAGDSGNMSLGLIPTFDPDTSKIINISYEDNCRPRVGIILRVGSLYARSYSAQDWWQTTLIQEIIEDTDKHVKFRTTNSIYEWKIF